MNWYRARKLGRTLRVLWLLGCARMLGEYVHSGWDDFPYVRYRWRGVEWIMPTGPVDADDEDQMEDTQVFNYCCHGIELRDCEQCSRGIASGEQL